jgi:hypothetical protein
LRIAADNNEAVAAGLERENYRRMQPVRVLIFVDQNMVRTAPRCRGRALDHEKSVGDAGIRGIDTKRCCEGNEMILLFHQDPAQTFGNRKFV